MSKDTGGPAFPAEEIDDDQSVSQNRIVVKEMHLGMSLRDWYAGKAMEAIISATVMRDDGFLDRIWRFIVGGRIAAKFVTGNTDQAATTAYAHADAMIAERNK